MTNEEITKIFKELDEYVKLANENPNKENIDCLKENVIYKVENEDVHIELGGSENKCSAGISVYVLKRNCYHYLKTADYGKTWALTKEELDYDK